MEVGRPGAEVNDANGWHLVLGHRGKTCELNSLVNDLLGLIFAQIAESVPNHVTSFEPLCLHRLELIVIKRIQNSLEGGLFYITGIKECVELSVGKLVYLVQIEVCPFHLEFLFDLVEDLTAFNITHGTKLLHRLTDKVDE